MTCAFPQKYLSLASNAIDSQLRSIPARSHNSVLLSALVVALAKDKACGHFLSVYRRQLEVSCESNKMITS